MRLAVTSDLHYDPAGHLTPPPLVRDLARAVAAERPDAVVLAGDLAHGLRAFRECVRCFADVGAPVAVLAGNHDVWRDDEAGVGSAELWGGALARVARAEGALWLEGEVLRVGDAAVVGSMAWYDYSAMDPTVRATPDEAALAKRFYNNDAAWVDWGRDDRDVARALADGLAATLARAAADPGVRAVAVVTHVPVLEEQMVRKPHDPRWGFSNAYFGHLTLGARVVAEPKVRAVVSGHTHGGREAVRERPGAPPVDVRVVGSDYGAPAYVVLEV